MDKTKLIEQIFSVDIFSLNSKEILIKQSISLSLWGISIFLIVFLSIFAGLFFEDGSVYWYLFKNFLTLIFLLFFFRKINYDSHKIIISFRYNLLNIKKHFFVSMKYIFLFFVIIFFFSFSFEMTSKLLGTEKMIMGIISSIPDSEFQLNLKYKFLNEKFDFYIYVFSLCVFTPFVEEILYRRFLYVSLRKKFSFKLSMLFCSLIFSFFHFPEIIISFLGSCFLCYVYEREANISVPVIIHSIKNLFAILFMVFAF